MKKSLILFSLIFSFIQLKSQDWVEKMQNPEVNFYDVQKSFNEYWKGREIQRSRGWKQYKRWEYFNEPRVYPTGNRVDPSVVWHNFTTYKKKYAYKSTSSSDWYHLGPTAPPANGGDAGRLNCVAFHPTNPNIMYVGSPSGGLWKTTNGGANWIPLTDNLPSIGISDIVVDYSNPDIIYIATGDGDATDTYSIGVLKSLDGGNSFQPTGLTHTVQQRKTINKLIIHPSNPQILFAATSSGILRTYDGGVTWTNSTYEFTRDIAFKPNDPNTIYATTKTNFYKSTNAGLNFYFRTVQFISPTSRIQIGVSPANPDYVYLLAGNSTTQGYGGLYRSVNSGENFSLQSSTPNILDWSTDGSGSGGQAWYDLALAVSPTNAEMVFVGGVNIWRSTNGGVNWSLNAHWYGGGGKPYVHADIHALRYSPLNVLFACTDGGLSVTSNNGTNWTSKNNGLAIAQIYRLSTSKTSPYKIITGWQDNGSNLNNNNSWERVYGGDGMECIIDYTNQNINYVSTPNGNIHITYNSNNFSTITNSITSIEEGAWVTPYVIDPINPQTLYAGYYNVWKTTDRGNTWTQISNFSGTTQIKSLAVAPSNPDYIYCATNGNIYKTTNGGQSWTGISSGISGGAITYIAVSTSDPDVLWVTISGYTDGFKVFESRDGGINWTNISGTLPNIPANCISYNPQSNEGLYIGMDVGVYYRDTLIGDWILFSNKLPNVVVNELEISPSINRIRAATYGRGLWESPLYEPAKVNNLTSDLIQPIVYPNPTINTVNIDISNLPDNDYQIEIVNSEGKKILEHYIHDKKIFVSDISEQPNGIYFVNIKSKGKKYSSSVIKVSK
jgi:hypothetical protein